MNDADLQAELLVLFADECAKTRKIISIAPLTIVLIETGHKIQGAAKAVGAQAVAHFGELLEKDPENGENITNLMRELKRVEDYIQLLSGKSN